MDREKDFFAVLRSIKGKFCLGISGVYFLKEKITPEEFEKHFSKIATKQEIWGIDDENKECYEMLTNDHKTRFIYFPERKIIEFT